MKLYYKAIGKDGKFVQGIIDAKDTSQAAGYLRSKEFIPVKISKKEKSKFMDSIPLFGRKSSARDILIFTRQLSSMLSAGLTLIKSLDILKEQLHEGLMAEVIDGIISDIEEGESFSSAISKFPKVFSPIYVSMIKASESSGLLDKALSRFADDLEKEQKLNSTVKGALLYPAIVIIGMIGVAAIMMIFVMPTLSELYKNFPNAELPLPTKIVIGLSNFTVKFWPVPVIILILIFLFFRRWRNTETGRLIVDSLVLKLPIFGILIRKLILTKLSRTLGLLVGTGTLVVQSLEQVSDVTGNIHFKNAIIDVSKRVEKGESMGDAMSHYTLFPPVLIQLIKSGEQTGKIDEILIKASEYFEGEVDETVKTLTTAMEPAIMIVLGIGVAFLVISVLTPIYSLISAF